MCVCREVRREQEPTISNKPASHLLKTRTNKKNEGVEYCIKHAREAVRCTSLKNLQADVKFRRRRCRNLRSQTDCNYMAVLANGCIVLHGVACRSRFCYTCLLFGAKSSKIQKVAKSRARLGSSWSAAAWTASFPLFNNLKKVEKI